MKAMREYKIEKKPAKELRDEDIMKYKDFGKLTTNYESALQRLHKKPLYKDPKAFLTLLLIAVVAYLVFLAIEEEEAEKQKALDEMELNEGTPTPAPDSSN